MADTPVLAVDGLRKHFAVRTGLAARRWLRAVDGVTFAIREGETLGLVGESGSGKSTVARCVLGLERPTGGRVRVQGRDITSLRFNVIRPLRRYMQMVFQNPSESLNPRLTVGAMLREPFRLFHAAPARELSGRVAALLRDVGLSPAYADRYPHQLSGGQQQRVAVARAIALGPKLVVLDEPTSDLDVSVQAKLLTLLKALQRELRLAYLFISHDLSVVGTLADRVAVMYLGQIVEIGPAREVLGDPRHPYTRALVSSIPVAHPKDRGERQAQLAGEIPRAGEVPGGCRLAGRCPHEMPVCAARTPALTTVSSGHRVACYLYDNDPDRRDHG